MPERNRTYVPQYLSQRLRRQAVKVWFAALLIAAGWMAAIASAPLLLSANIEHIAAQLYGFFGHICHQIAERSIHIGGHPLAVCSRCFGVYFGLLAGLAVYPLWRPIDETEPLARFWLFLSLVPIGFDWSLTVFGVWENTHLSRFATGGILGLACATFIVPALVEATRNLTLRRLSGAQTSAAK